MNISFSWQYFLTFIGGMIILYWIVFVVAIWIKGYLNEIRIDQWFTRDLGISGYFLGALAGAITPFCSCTTVPIFVGMIESEIRLGYAMSFLIASPTLNPPAIILFYALFGNKMMFIYIGACYIIAVIGGLILGSNKFKQYLIEIFFINPDDSRFRFKEVNIQYLNFMSSFIIIIIIAAAIATWLKGWVPSVEFLELVEQNQLTAIPAAVFLGEIIYADIALLIPIGKLFLVKGLDIGLIFAFMMAASGVGLPSILLLTRIFKLRLLILYLLTIFILITMAGVFVSMINF